MSQYLDSHYCQGCQFSQSMLSMKIGKFLWHHLKTNIFYKTMKSTNKIQKPLSQNPYT